MDHYAVMGYPIAHSKSPTIHQLFARQTQQKMEYGKLEVPPENFKHALLDFVHKGGRGLNITIPLKTLAWEQMDELDEKARHAKAVNTIAIQTNNKLTGYNTDGIGLVRDINHNHNINLKNKKILLLGAGGAVQGVLLPLLECKPASVTITNRTVEKAEALCIQFEKFGHIQAGSYADLKGRQFDIIINGTSSSLKNQIPPLPDKLLASNGVSYDMMYSDQATAFVCWGQQQGAAKALDGLGMLVEQAAEAFYIWRGLRPDTKAVIAQLRHTN